MDEQRSAAIPDFPSISTAAVASSEPQMRGRGTIARWRLAIYLLAFSFIAAYLDGLAARKWRKSAQPSQEVIGGLAVVATDLDMGEVGEEKCFAWQLPIRNVSAGRIEIHDFIQTCDCIDTIKPRHLSIAPGETAIIDLTLDLTHRTYSELGKACRPFSVEIWPVLNPKTRPGLGWKMYGTIVSRVTLDKLSIHFGERPVHGGRPVTQKVVATVHVPCQRLEVIVKPEVVTATIKRWEDNPDRFEITIHREPRLAARQFPD